MQQQPAALRYDSQRLGVTSLAGRRSANEDAWAAPPLGMDTTAGALYVVADGVGGQERGDLAAQTAVVATFRAFYERRSVGDDVRVALRAAVERANGEVNQLARGLGLEQMGCTLVTVAVADGRLYVAHVGDTRAYLFQGGRLYPLTRDHTWVQEQVDRGTITAEDAARHELRHIVTRVLGNGPEIEATVSGPAIIGSGDRLLLTTDGVHHVVDDGRMAQLAAGGTPIEAAEALAAEALALGSEDNVTALVAVVGTGGVVGMGKAPSPVARENLTAGGSTAGEGQIAALEPPRRRTAILPALLLAAMGLAVVILLATILTRCDQDEPQAALDEPAGTPGQMIPAAVYPSAGDTVEPEATSTDAFLPEAGYPEPDEIVSPVVSSLMCIDHKDEVYIWTNEQAEDGDLCQVAHYVLPDRRVMILAEPKQMPAWQDCNLLNFVQVQSLENPDLIGWIWDRYLEQCPEEQ